MKLQTLLQIVDMLLGMVMGIIIGFAICNKLDSKDLEWYRVDNSYKAKMIEQYRQYYTAAENLLNQLDEKYDWIDAFDPQDLEEVKMKLDSLFIQKQ